ncbi:MAG: hypothetical protein JXO44_00925 [Clostridia bacterium]|nr:hypothetical protein [Clostridia bacterium]
MIDRKNIKSYLILMLTLIMVGILVQVYINTSQKGMWKASPSVHEGSVVVSDELLSNYKVIPLTGEWHFYTSSYLMPDQMTDMCYMPNLKGVYGVDGFLQREEVDSASYGTYHLTVTNHSAYKRLQLYFQMAMADAYSVYIDGEAAFKIGDVGINAESTDAMYDTYILDVEVPESVEVVIQAASFSQLSNGLRKPIILGIPENIQRLKYFNYGKDIFVLGILSMFISYFSFIWVKNRINGFPILCFIYASVISALYVLTSNEMLIQSFLPNTTFRIQDIMQYMLALSGGCVYVLLIYHLYREESSYSVVKLSFIKTLLFVMVNIAFSRHLVMKYILAFSLITLLEFLFGMYVLTKAHVNKKEGTIPLLLGTMVLLSAIIYDRLYVLKVIYSPYGVITPLALSVFILSFAVVVARQYERSFQEVRNLSEQLIEKDQVKDRFLANTSHELKTPINSMIALTQYLINDGNLESSDLASLEIVAESGMRLKYLINDLLDYSAIKQGHLNLVKSDFHIEPMLTTLVK